MSSQEFLFRQLGRFLPYLLAVVASFVAAGVFIAAMGFDVPKAYMTILFTSFKSANGFVQTLIKFVPLLLQALAFTIPLAAGKFNIGGATDCGGYRGHGGWHFVCLSLGAAAFTARHPSRRAVWGALGGTAGLAALSLWHQ
jgi:hypothetical protein